MRIQSLVAVAAALLPAMIAALPAEDAALPAKDLFERGSASACYHHLFDDKCKSACLCANGNWYDTMPGSVCDPPGMYRGTRDDVPRNKPC